MWMYHEPHTHTHTRDVHCTHCPYGHTHIPHADSSHACTHTPHACTHTPHTHTTHPPHTACVKDLIRSLRDDDSSCEIRRQLGKACILQKVASWITLALVLQTISVPQPRSLSVSSMCRYWKWRNGKEDVACKTCSQLLLFAVCSRVWLSIMLFL